MVTAVCALSRGTVQRVQAMQRVCIRSRFWAVTTLPRLTPLKVNLNDRNSQNSTSFEATWEWAAEGVNRTAVRLSILNIAKGR